MHKPKPIQRRWNSDKCKIGPFIKDFFCSERGSSAGRDLEGDGVLAADEHFAYVYGPCGPPYCFVDLLTISASSSQLRSGTEKRPSNKAG